MITNRPHPATVLRVLNDRRLRIFAAIAEVDTDDKPNWFRHEYYVCDYERETARRLAMEALMRALGDCDDDIARVDDELAVLEGGDDDYAADLTDIHVVAGVLRAA